MSTKNAGLAKKEGYKNGNDATICLRSTESPGLPLKNSRQCETVQLRTGAKTIVVKC